MRLHFIALLLCAALLPGCAGTSGAGAHAGEAYMVKAEHTPFYSYGPAQATGPDSSLPRGTRLTMLSYEYGFSHVAIAATNQTGYVSTDDVAAAPPLPKATPPPVPRHHRIMEEAPYPKPVREDTNELPVFQDTLPPPGAPPFRY